MPPVDPAADDCEIVTVLHAFSSVFCSGAFDYYFVLFAMAI
jgi:hypothetical protein